MHETAQLSDTVANNNAGLAGRSVRCSNPCAQSLWPHPYYLLCPLLSPISTSPEDKPSHALDWASGKMNRKLSLLYLLVGLTFTINRIYTKEAFPLSASSFYWAQVFSIYTFLSCTWSKHSFIRLKSSVKSKGTAKLHPTLCDTVTQGHRFWLDWETKSFPTSCSLIDCLWSIF